jgi:tetratricopeptide (TPR) repeat protein
MIKPILFTGAVILAVFISSTILPAQEGRGKGRIVGVVLDEDNNPIEGVEVHLQSTNFNFSMTTKSNAKGEWGFIGFGRDLFSFTFKKEGYLPGSAQVALVSVGKNPDQTIILKKGSPIPEIPKGAIAVSETVKADVKKADDLFNEKKYAEALPYYEAIIQQVPEAYKILGYKLANCLRELEMYPRAIEEYEKVIESLKKDDLDIKEKKIAAEAYVNIGDIYLKQEKFEEAAKNYIKSMEIVPPTDAAVAYNVAEICFSAEKIDDAVKYYKLAIELRPDFAGYHKKLGYAYLNLGEIDTAKTYFQKFLEMAPNDPEAPSIKEILSSL